jgi:flagellar biogenesis protein FliO
MTKEFPMTKRRKMSAQADRVLPLGLRHPFVFRASSIIVLLTACLFDTCSVFAQTNSTNLPLTAPTLPDAGLSLFRVVGALALVIGLFLGGVWFFRNWQRIAIQRGRAPKLNVLETRSLGGRHALFVVGYEQERFLIASSPSGVNLVSHLPTAVGSAESEATKTGTPSPSFAQALTQVLKGK